MWIVNMLRAPCSAGSASIASSMRRILSSSRSEPLRGRSVPNQGPFVPAWTYDTQRGSPVDWPRPPHLYKYGQQTRPRVLKT